MKKLSIVLLAMVLVLACAFAACEVTPTTYTVTLTTGEGYTLSGTEDFVGTESITVYRLMDKMMVRPAFKVEGPVYEGVALNSADKKFGFIKPDGTQAIPCEYDYTPSCVSGDMLSSSYRFSNGVAAVRKNGKWGYIDHNGNSTF